MMSQVKVLRTYIYIIWLIMLMFFQFFVMEKLEWQRYQGYWFYNSRHIDRFLRKQGTTAIDYLEFMKNNGYPFSLWFSKDEFGVRAFLYRLILKAREERAADNFRCKVSDGSDFKSIDDE